MKDYEIIKLFLDRDPAAVAGLREAYGKGALSVACSVLSSPEDAEECVNDAYMKLWSSIPPQRPENLPAYLYRTVRNLAIDRLRHDCAQKRGAGGETAVFDELADYLPSPHNLEDELFAKELFRQIGQFLQELSPNDRSIFVCRYWLEMATADIAGKLRLKEGCVRMSLHRSRKKLYTHLKKEELL